MTLPKHGLASDLRRRAEASGFGLHGAVDAGEYDEGLSPAQKARRSTARLPNVGTIVVLGTGGRDCWESMQSSGPVGEARPDYHPIDAASSRRLLQLVDWLDTVSVRAQLCMPDESDALDFLRLASLAGIGTISPVIGLLLHEKFGPWVSLRGALLIEGRPFGPIPASPSTFDPCTACPKPCVAACPVDVFDGVGGIDLQACTTQRLGGGCGSGCDARRACPVGADARYGATEENFRHAYSLFAMRRWASEQSDRPEDS